MDWARIPSSTCRDIAVAIESDSDVKPHSGADEAIWLQQEFAAPDEAFMAMGAPGRTVAHVVRDALPALGGIAVTFSRAESAGLVSARKGPAPSTAGMVRRLRACRIDRNLRSILLEALLEAGSASRGAEAGRVLAPVMHISTDDRPLGQPLHPHQRQVTNDLDLRWAKDRNKLRGLVVMPTGSGKTRTTVDWLLAGPVSEGCKVLWLTHSVYLLEQTAGVFQDQAPLARLAKGELVVRLVGGGHSPGTTIASPMHDVVIATVQSFHKKRTRDHVREWLKANEVVVVFDEAHHAVAPSWRAPLEMAVNETNDAIIGLTATPTRLSSASTADLAALFGATGPTMEGAIISEIAVDDLVEQGVLARPVFHTIDTNFDFASVLTAQDEKDIARFGDFSERVLAQLVQQAPRNHAIVNAYLNGPDGTGRQDFGQAIVYAVNIAHAEVLRKLFDKAGVSCEAIFHTRGRDENAASLDRFRNSETRVLVNVEMLTEGIDAPAAEAVLLARPTLSFALFSQMVGRALRGPKVGGTAYAHIVDFRDLLGTFEEWRVDFSRLKLVDQLPEEAGDPSERSPLVPYELEPLIELGLALSDRHETPAGGAVRRLPVGYYLIGIDATSDEGEPRLRAHLVFDHDQAGYDAIEREVQAGGAAGLARRRWTTFFAGLREPTPSEEALWHLRTFVVREKQMPPFIELDAIDQLSPTAVAQHIVDTRGALFDDLEAGTAEAYERDPRVVDRIWGGRSQFEREVRDEWARILKGLPVPKEEKRIRSITLGEVEEWDFGDGGIDLDAVMAGLLEGLELFPERIRYPKGRITWSKQPIREWAFYEPGSERIVVNCVLNSSRLIGLAGGLEALRFLVFHELLHHEQNLLDVWPGEWSNTVIHDDAFYRREHQYPGFEIHDAFLDDFFRQFTPRALWVAGPCPKCGHAMSEEITTCSECGAPR